MDIWILSLGLLGIMSSWAFVYMCLYGYIFISLGYVLRSGIRLYGMLIFCGCLTNYHKFRSLENQKRILEARVQNQGVSRPMLLLEPVRESFLSSFQPLVVCWWSLEFPGLQLHDFGFCPCHHMTFSLCVRVFTSLRTHKKPSYTELRVHPILCDLILSNYICNGPLST